MNADLSFLEEDSSAAPDGGELSRVTALAEKMLEAARAAAELEERLRAAKEDHRRLSEEQLPALMAELGLAEFKLADGTRIEVKSQVSCAITEERRAAAHEWLRASGFAGLIKTELAVQFDRAEGAAAEHARATLQSLLPEKAVALEERVHPSTLKSFVRERLEAGAPPPFELFAVRPFDQAKATLPKGR